MKRLNSSAVSLDSPEADAKGERYGGNMTADVRAMRVLQAILAPLRLPIPRKVALGPDSQVRRLVINKLIPNVKQQ